VSKVPASEQERRLIAAAVARLRVGLLATVGGLLAGSGLAFATAWLTLLGGDPVGPHLALLRYFFPGYTVTWTGVSVGFAYGALAGAIAGGTVGWLYNRLVDWRADRR
jgi:hypothetical protein